MRSAVEQEHAARERAERVAGEALSAQEEAASKAASKVQDLKRHIREAEQECCDAKGRVFRLGAQLGAKHVELARAVEREHEALRIAEQAALDAARVKADGTAAANAKLQHLRSRAKEAEIESRLFKGAVERLERLRAQLGAAHVEEVKAIEREAKARKEAEEAAHHAARTQVEAVAQVTEMVYGLRCPSADSTGEG